MKKIIALLLALILVMGLVACGAKEEASTTVEEETVVEETPAVEEEDAPAAEEETTEEETAEETTSLPTATEGVLTMATNAAFPPYEYVEGNEIVGIDAEIAKAIADKLGLELQIDDMEFDSITTAVQGGKADIGLAGMTVTEERMEVVDFTVSYATGVQVVIVTENSPITTVDDLFAEGTSHVIGVQRNTTGDLYCTWDLEDNGLATIERYSKGVDAVQALATGKVDCVVIDNEPAKAFVESMDGLKILDTEYALEDYAGAMDKTRPELYEAVNAALEELIADGTIAAIVNKYIPAA